MSDVKRRIEKLEAQTSGGDDKFLEALAERVRWLPDDEFAAILEMMRADLAGEDIEPEALEALNAIIAEVWSDFTETS